MAIPSRHVDRLDDSRMGLSPPARGLARGSSRPRGTVLGHFNPPGLILLS